MIETFRAEPWAQCHFGAIEVPEPLPPSNELRDRNDLLLYRISGAFVIARCWFYVIVELAREYGFRESTDSHSDTPESTCQWMLGHVTATDAKLLAAALRQALGDLADDIAEDLPEYLVEDRNSIGEPLLANPPGLGEWLAGRKDLVEYVATFCDQGAFHVYDPAWVKWWSRSALAH